VLGVNISWKLVVSSHGQPEEQNLGLAVIYSCVSNIEGLVDVFVHNLSMWHKIWFACCLEGADQFSWITYIT
jgi:hypothetical protein